MSNEKRAIQSPGGLIAFIIPVFRHSSLLNDAISSVLSADGSENIELVIVDDGCPNFETALLGAGAASSDARITYLRGPNKGLSGARNVGIEYLQEHSQAIAYYFLDADNMISEWSIMQMRNALRRSPDYHWFYPDIDTFGIEHLTVYPGTFNPLDLAIENICEAGSLIRAEVFGAGVRFEEKLKLGFEDWDFFLTASELGFRGKHFPASGFQYRKRPESMLADADRDRGGIVRALEERHPWMSDVRWLAASENKVAPRFAFLLSDRGTVSLSSGEVFSNTMAVEQYVSSLVLGEAAPTSVNVGQFIVSTTSTALSLLRSTGLLGWALYDLEKRLNSVRLASLTLTSEANGFGITVLQPAGDIPPDMTMLKVSIFRDTVQDSSNAWLIDQLYGRSGASHTTRGLSVLRRGEDRSGGPGIDVREAFVQLRDKVRAVRPLGAAFVAPTRFNDRVGLRRRDQVGNALRSRNRGSVIPPHFERKHIEIAFILPIVDFGGVEKVTLSVAKAFRDSGYGTTLIVFRSLRVELASEVKESFDRVFFVDNDRFEDWSGPRFMGTNLPEWGLRGDRKQEISLLSAFDVLINCHGADAFGLLGDTRRAGVVTAAYLHVFDETRVGVRCGHPDLAIAYEHAIDLMVGCSDHICSQLHAEGVPLTKLISVPNAASPAVSRRPHARAAKSPDEPLSVLYVGRLDRQKGLQRLEEIYRSLSAEASIRFRVIGKAIVDGMGFSAVPPFPVEAPLYSPEKLQAAYDWADILLLPSDYEGLPLTVLEAMQRGCVPVVTDVGASHEIVRNGRNGFIFNIDDYVASTLDTLRNLAGDRSTLCKISARAWSDLEGRTWDRAIVPLASRIDELVAKKRAGVKYPPIHL